MARDRRDIIPDDEAAALRAAEHGTVYGKCGHPIKSCGCHDEWPQLDRHVDTLCRTCAAQAEAAATPAASA